VVRSRLCQPRGLNVALPSGQPLIGPSQGQDVAALYFYQNAERPAIDAERQLVILRTLLPAFAAGAYIALRVGERGLLTQLTGALAEGVVLFDERARVVYANPAFRQLLAEEPDAARIERECAHAGRLVLTVARPMRAKSRREEIIGPGAKGLRTSAAAYQLRGVLLGPGVLGLGPMALVVLERTTPGRRSVEGLRAQFHLTPRELGVSRLLAEGRSNEAVARLLGVSIHTARRHVEHVLLKLGVHSRAAVGAKLRETETSRIA
jgi:DNA-binding CsgD family transcriptional regulator